MGIANVRGQFEEFEGTLEIGNDLSSAKVYGKVNAQSGDTNEPRRDEHLRSPDFLDAARFPEIAFESSRIEALDGDRFRITGRLTIHGVTNELVLHAGVHGTHTDLYGNERIGLEVTGTLSRGDYGMRFTWGSEAATARGRQGRPGAGHLRRQVPRNTCPRVGGARRRRVRRGETGSELRCRCGVRRMARRGRGRPVVRCAPIRLAGSERAGRRWRRG